MQRHAVSMLTLTMLACSSDEAREDAAIFPDQIRIVALAGGTGVLVLTALTLREADGDVELYAALKNTSEQPACSAALSVELFDAAQQPLAAGIGGLHTQQLYRLADSDQIAACVAPGTTTMAAIGDWPSELAVADVRFAVYRCSYFALDVLPIAGLTLRDVEQVGAAYAGTLVNELDIAVTSPSVTVFALNRVGRPLGTALAREAIELAPGAHWEFATSALDAGADDFVAYPAAAFSEEER